MTESISKICYLKKKKIKRCIIQSLSTVTQQLYCSTLFLTYYYFQHVLSPADTDLRVVIDGNEDHLRNERGGNRIHADRDRSPIDGGDRLRDSERDRTHGDIDRLRGRDKDTDLRNRERNRPMARDRDRDRDRGRDRDKFRDGRYDQYSRGRERLEDDDKWSDRKHDDRKFDRESRGR